MSISKYNEGSVKWNVDSKEFTYKKLSELEEGKNYPLCGMFVSKDHGFGEGAVLITCDYCINIPQRYVTVIRQIMTDQAAIDDINNGKCAFRYSTFESEKFHRTGYRVDFIDL